MSSFRIKLLVLSGFTGLLMFIFILIGVPYMVGEMADHIKTADSRYLTGIVADSLSAGVRDLPTDKGAALDHTIGVIQEKSDFKIIESLTVYDKDRSPIRGDRNADASRIDASTPHYETVNERIVATAPLKSGETLIGHVRIVFTPDMVAGQRSGRYITLSLVISLCIIVVGFIFSLLMTRNIIGLMERIATQMDTGAEQVSSASGEVASASQSLAQGSAEQASAIEETSSALNEMASMTQQNADNAKHADKLMRDTSGVIGRADESMNRLTSAMKDITTASKETSKIIKTIDEIAFQTNLLSLNAAVEAARAGEAGAGFAVVAEEVRNLAMRSAEAARNTSSLIEGTLKKIQYGATLVTGANTAFGEVAASASKVAELVSEISASSTEQARGIDQINTALSEMDKITQQNAASAEESASSAQYLNELARQMKRFVSDLVTLIKGANATLSTAAQTAGTPPAEYIQRPADSPPPPERKNGTGRHSSREEAHPRKSAAVHDNESIRPMDEIFPMDESDFKEF